MTTTAHKPAAFELRVYSAAQVLAALFMAFSGTASTTCMLIARWLMDALKRDQDQAKAFLCITCDAAFNGRDATSHEWSVVVITPMAEEVAAMVSGMCPTCSEKSDALSRIVTSLRTVIPDARIVQEGHA